MKQSLLKAELSSILKNRMKLISIMAIIFIPILYSGVYLWAFWDPYGNLEKLPVAVVNEDSGAEMNNEKLELGKDLVENLKENDEFAFTFVNKKEGYQNLKNQKYYMLIEIPKDFSKNATTLLDDDPKKLDLVYVSNPGYNFISSQIGNSAMERIKESVSKEITKTYAKSVFDHIGEMADGLKNASTGAKELEQGTSKVNAGSKEVYDNLATLAEKSIEFNQGVSSANSGAKKLLNGAENLAGGLGQLQNGQQNLANASTKLQDGDQAILNGISQTNEGINTLKGSIPSLIGGTNSLKQGSDSLSENLKNWSSKSAELAEGAKQLNAGTKQLQETIQSMLPLLQGLPEDKQNELMAAIQGLVDGSASISNNTEELAQGANQLAAGGESLSSGLTELNQGHEKLQTGVNQLADGSAQLKDGSQQQVAGQKQFVAGMNKYTSEFSKATVGSKDLVGGMQSLLTGMNTLETGSNALSNGTNQLKNGSKELSQGTSSLLDGSKELSGKLTDGANDASSIHSDDKTYNMMAEPVKVSDEKLTDVPNYGTGLAPYFISLGLFVGALMLSIVFSFNEPEGIPKNGINWFLSKTVILIVVGTLQALVASFVLLEVLGIEVQSVPLFILFTIIVSMVFFSIIQFCVTLLGNPGRFLVILLLIFQLTTSAGTFPLELIPNTLQHVHAILPMSYSVAGLKAVISSGDFTFMWHNASILAIYPIVFIIGTISYFVVSFRRKYGELAVD
ncbi:YhgE/Pip family protein [Niallia sp. 01092]|uniref:YhgE/Pip family protein n=1 Tax=unclassified Niallia TaxID=2837522 RepID=UPI003FD0046A